MTFPEEALRHYSLADPAIASLCGERWYTVDLPQLTAFPAVTVQQISGGSEHNQQGHSGLENGRWQVTVHAKCFRECSQLAWAIERRLEGRRGQWGSPDVGWLSVQRCAKVNRVVLGKDPGQVLYRIAIDFYLMFRRSDVQDA